MFQYGTNINISVPHEFFSETKKKCFYKLVNFNFFDSTIDK